MGGDGPDGGGNAATGNTGTAATGNAEPEERGIFGLATGGGGCACRAAPSRGAPAALALSLMLIGALVRRRRGAAKKEAA
jgi:MYXO-CTERM domain-containing protein